MRKKNYLKHLAAGLFALTMTVSLAAPVQLSAAFVSGSKPKLNSNPVYITDANGKKTGIKTFSIGPYTYNNLSVDKDITSTPTMELTTIDFSCELPISCSKQPFYYMFFYK